MQDKALYLNLKASEMWKHECRGQRSLFICRNLHSNVGKKANSLLHNAALDGHQGVVDFDKVILAVLLQIHRVKVQLDDVVGVCSQLPLDEGVRGIRAVGEAGGLNLPQVICLRMFWEAQELWERNKMLVVLIYSRSAVAHLSQCKLNDD